MNCNSEKKRKQTKIKQNLENNIEFMRMIVFCAMHNALDSLRLGPQFGHAELTEL